MKQCLKGFVIGLLTAVLLLSTVTVMAQTRAMNITYGVRVVVNGVQQNFAYDMRPFIGEGRTFLPVRGIADALGLDVMWNEATSTVYLNSPTPVTITLPAQQPIATLEPIPTPQQMPVSMNIAAPPFESFGPLPPRMADFAIMGGTIYDYALIFGGSARGTMGPRTEFTLHNLNGQFNEFSGYIGRIDGTPVENTILTVIGDNRPIETINVQADALPVNFSIPVEGVRLLRIEIQFGFQSLTEVAIIGFLE